MIANATKNSSPVITNPEIVVGLVGPIGVDLAPVQDSVITELEALGYKTAFIKVTDLMQQWEIEDAEISEESFTEYYKSLINYAGKFRESCSSHSALAALAINEIRERRLEVNSKNPDHKDKTNKQLADEPVRGTAYIIRQFKLPQEIELMRLTYGRKFIQISVYLDQEERKKSLKKSIQNFNSKRVSSANAETQAIELIEIDSNEENKVFGQRVTDVFHLGDVFVPGGTDGTLQKTTARFFKALFGSNAISPTKMEYGMYAAAGAALRSIDLSRQVGAAIFNREGEVQTLGCNEVPKAFGGTYWEDDEQSIHRDFEEGLDANQSRKIEILHDFVTRLHELKLLNNISNPDPDTEISELVRKLVGDKTIKDSQLMDIIEFGRMVHAEMNAITDSARLGKPIKNSILYCTTFPCHMCAKHIVSSGIKKVVFLEPYPKSYAEDLHSDSITFNVAEEESKVFFEPFTGISPRRYRDIFEKKKRKNGDGSTRQWYEGKPVPQIEDRSSSYIENEVPALAYGGLRKLSPKTKN